MFVSYGLSLVSEQHTLVAMLDVTGEKRNVRVRANAQLNGDAIVLTFVENRAGNEGESFQPGQVLLSLHHKGRNLRAEWSAVYSQCSESGAVFENNHRELPPEEPAQLPTPDRAPSSPQL